jgi:hypothetical protein
MLERVVELLGGPYRGLDCCGPTSRQRWKLRRSWKNRKAVLIPGAALCTSLF